MKLKEFDYKVSAVVKFTKAEADTLIKLAKLHYDGTCIEAALELGEEHPKVGKARANGFLAQLKMFSLGPAVWPFRNFDLVLKILECVDTYEHCGMITKVQANTGRHLTWELSAVCTSLSVEYARLVSGEGTVDENVDGRS